jgi:hypothetical protein
MGASGFCAARQDPSLNSCRILERPRILCLPKRLAQHIVSTPCAGSGDVTNLRGVYGVGAALLRGALRLEPAGPLSSLVPHQEGAVVGAQVPTNASPVPLSSTPVTCEWGEGSSVQGRFHDRYGIRRRKWNARWTRRVAAHAPPTKVQMAPSQGIGERQANGH